MKNKSDKDRAPILPKESENQPEHRRWTYPLNDFDYKVATMAWQKGLSANAIVARLGLEKTPQNITSVRRALQKAVKHGLLKIHPPLNHSLENELATVFPALKEIHVEPDQWETCLRAAQMIAARIEEFLVGEDREMTIANAGGRTLRDTINYLQRLVPIPPNLDEKRLVFLSLNAAEQPNRFDECANFLSVRMAEIYGAAHLAVVKDPATDKVYHEAVAKIDFLISSAGAENGLLREWLHHRGYEFPAEAVGDIGFHLITAKGEPLELEKKLARSIRDELRPAPSWDHLARLFRENKVLLILRGAKQEIALSILKSAHAKTCVIEYDLGKRVLGLMRQPLG